MNENIRRKYSYLVKSINLGWKCRNKKKSVKAWRENSMGVGFVHIKPKVGLDMWKYVPTTGCGGRQRKAMGASLLSPPLFNHDFFFWRENCILRLFTHTEDMRTVRKIFSIEIIGLVRGGSFCRICRFTRFFFWV